MEQRLEVLFKEYDTLRTEIISRMGHMFQIIGFGAALVAVFLPWVWSRSTDVHYWVVVPFIAIVCFGLWAMVHIEIANAAARIREIELEVNTIAGHDLLRWETRRGRARNWLVTELLDKIRHRQSN